MNSILAKQLAHRIANHNTFTMNRNMMNINALVPRTARHLLGMNRDPFQDLVSNVRGFDERFPRLLSRSGIFPDPVGEMMRMMSPARGLWSEEADALTPILSADVLEQKDAFKIHIDLPGIKKEDLDVDITDDYISIKGERKQVHEENSDYIMQVERHWGKVARTIPVPKGVNVKEAKANFENGVLEVSLPKVVEAIAEAPRKLEITEAKAEKVLLDKGVGAEGRTGVTEEKVKMNAQKK